MKKMRFLFTMLLAVMLIINTNLTALASSTTPLHNTTSSKSSTVILKDTGVTINGTYYTKNQFIKLLDSAKKVESTRSRSALALVAGTWYIPGIGEIVITAAGTILIAGIIIEAGSWLFDVISDWFATRAFNQSAEDAVNNCDSNKQNHIMNSKHNWNKFNKDPKWSDVSPILIKVLKDGVETWEKNDQYIRTLVYKGETVVVRFIKDVDGLIKYISTAWCE